MRVAQISDWFAPRRGGIESQLTGLTRALTTAGAVVNVITPQPHAQDDLVPVHRLHGARLPGLDLAVSPLLVRRTRAALHAIAPDVVHIHASIVAPACVAGLIAARQSGLPVVITAHSDLSAMAPLLAFAGRLAGARLSGVALTAVNARIADHLGALVPGSRPLVLPNGFDAGFWMADSAPQAPAKAFRLVSAMRLERKKRPQVLLSVRDTVARALDHPVEMVVAGTGRRHARLGDGVTTPGWLDRSGLRALYRGAHAFVLPSRHESFGIAALEARAAGLPVIGRAGNGLSEFIRDGEDGFLCANDSAMSEAALRLARDPALWRRLAGPRPALARYDWAVVAQTHLALYARLCSGG
ncbi:MAG: glycosyltransferase family 4 protein [Rhodobacteraceae bacterium]|nr:glycosyltransferase family 4 protein [Paracoccaceae bacterium]